MILNRVRFQRKRKMLKQYQLARKVDTHPSVISLIENGILEPKTKLKKKLAKVLGCKASELFPKSPIASRLG